MLMVYGSVFFATAPLVEEQLPEVTEESRHAVVLLNLRGEDDLGSTFLEILDRYAGSLREQDSKLMLSAVSQHVGTQLEQTGIAKALAGRTSFRLPVEWAKQPSPPTMRRKSGWPSSSGGG